MSINRLLATIALVVALPLQAATEILDQVVAIVDNDVIMASELQERLAAVNQTIAARGITPPPEEELIRETLDRLILESIQLQLGTRVGVRISDAQLNSALQRIAARNGMSLDQFRRALEERGQSYGEMREQLRRDMIIQRVQAGNVNQRIEISEQEVDNFLSTQEGQKLTQPEYRVVHALLPVSPDADETTVAAARTQVMEVLERIRGGADFEAAVNSSDAAGAFSGGDLGWRKLDDLPSLFTDIVPQLEEGETADPFRSDSGFHLVQLVGARGDEQMVSQTRVRHILIKPSEIMSEEQARELAGELRQRAMSGEDFGELARQYSEDIGTAAEGGDLGWTSPGQTVPEFEAAMADTPVGAISEPVGTEYGWHIIKVLERRNRDMTEEAIRNRARNHLHERKYQQELDAWLRQIRDEAFVDIK
ncbi:MAG: peptidylprolyl isomerase [Halioglobus sp.]|nr:peptidylprolyl isomerase [Halioglobus sp.]